MDGRRFHAPPAIGQLLLTAYAAELSEDGEILGSDDDDDDDDLPSFKKILTRPKQVIDLTHDDDGDSEGDDGNHIETIFRSPTNSLYPPPSSLPNSPAHAADDFITSSTAATPGRKEHPFINPPPWSKLYHKLQQCSDVDALHAGTDSSGSPLSEFEPAPKDSRVFVTKRLENSPEIPETPAVALKKMQGKEDSYSEDGEEHHGGSTHTVADTALEVDVASSSLRDKPHNEYNTGSVETDKRHRASQTKPIVNINDSDEPPLSIAESSGQTLAPVTVSGLPDLGEDNPVIINILYFTTAKILDKRSSPFRAEYRCELELL